jgi:hypothetical protein
MTMPHNSNTSDSFEAVMQTFQQGLNEQHLDPFIETIAHSMNEGFTPQTVVEDL